MMASLIYTLCLLFSPPTPPIYTGLVISATGPYLDFALTNRIPDDNEAFILEHRYLIVSEKDKKIFLENRGKLLQVVARESQCGTKNKILTVSWWKFAPVREQKK